MNFFARNAENLAEDASLRDPSMQSGIYEGRRRIGNAAEIDVDRIIADPQHREIFDEDKLQDLANSLRQHGQLQTIRVRWDEDRDRYIIIAGERRWRACKLAGIQAVRCEIVEGEIDENTIIREQIIENAIREDLKPTEKGRAFRDLMEREGWNGKELAEQLQLNPATISRHLALLDLPEDLQQQVDTGSLPIKQAIKAGKQVLQDGNESSGTQPSRKTKKVSKERKIVSGGYTVTIKARKLLTDERMIEALESALADMRSAPEIREAA